jgi:tRNA(Arg) A34 adenosine deaminase TadA
MSAVPEFDWADLAFGSKKPLNDLKATFIAAPRELSGPRLKQLLKQYLPQGNLVIGLSQEEYVLGLESQPQFRMLTATGLEPILSKLTDNIKAKINLLHYSQRDVTYLLDKLKFKQVVFINGSWYHAFHLRPEYYKLVQSHTPYALVSPFANEAEASAYAATHQPPAPALPPAPQSAAQMLDLANIAARQSFAYSEHQIGVALGRSLDAKPGVQARYRALATAHNRVVPYETYAMYHGASRERNFSPMNDLNHYDVNHAEVELLTQAVRNGLDLHGTTLFINLLPCPTCARMLTSTDIAEVVYTEDHSAGYAISMLEAAGKTIRRLVR